MRGSTCCAKCWRRVSLGREPRRLREARFRRCRDFTTNNLEVRQRCAQPGKEGVAKVRQIALARADIAICRIWGPTCSENSGRAIPRRAGQAPTLSPNRARAGEVTYALSTGSRF